MFYIFWIISAFVAVGAGCWLATLVDNKDNKSEK
ncbi:YbgT family membrane protein [Thiotrichales bacterium 19S11-10]|nr:YbgT family membrane protein [Thiotrichales bacterium 19S11-10]MCF6808017.1 YbgT family membrane protein [Thiotrichales bacterium 19S9-11]MCF6812032.1 YbgT family membrane protein [Thiotrichales bacterium 19S9-12]